MVDTSILLRLANTADASYSVAVQAVLKLHQSGETMHITAQNLVEFRNAATRPATANGLGLSTADVESKLDSFELEFPLLAETPAVFPTWKMLVKTRNVIGKHVHDARLAIYQLYGVNSILTFNVPHFQRLVASTGIKVIDQARM